MLRVLGGRGQWLGVAGGTAQQWALRSPAPRELRPSAMGWKPQDAERPGKGERGQGSSKGWGMRIGASGGGCP